MSNSPLPDRHKASGLDLTPDLFEVQSNKFPFGKWFKNIVRHKLWVCIVDYLVLTIAPEVCLGSGFSGCFLVAITSKL
ncbi:hypothetical protein SAMN04487891_102435 [Flagellimonas taeanensis]|uniref:Uncharacterized protein n=1 Tax=Flagellimonas taeanensis TaxID=1005926 RepID=A0A1M6SFV0_9FLAO|nr:hypothetical protein SAMN04487891_102435 [Allomuricauda taeanensis]SHK43545.1 hypothetical protein SAMN05216293_1115 [Allomuricauda taeanensis]